MAWESVAERRRSRGTAVAVAVLGAPAAPGPFVARHAAAVAEAAVATRETDVLVVGHSGAGPLLPLAGEHMAGRGVGRAGYVFVDAGLPHPGRSRLASFHPSLRAQLAGMASDGVLPPWSEWWGPGALDALVPDPGLRERLAAESPPVPVALLEEPLPEVPGWPDAPCAYLRLSAAYEVEEAEAAGLGWAVASLDGHHLQPLVDPDAVADAVVALAGRIGIAL